MRGTDTLAPIWADINRAKTLTDAKYSGTILNELADDAEDDIRAELISNGLSVNPQPVPELVRVAAKNWLLRNIRRLQKHDGTAPSMKVIGGYTESVSIDQTIADYDSKGRVALDQYIADQSDDDGDDDGDSLVFIAKDE